MLSTRIIVGLALIGVVTACASRPPIGDPNERTLRRYYKAGSLEEATAELSDDYRLWFEEKSGEGIGLEEATVLLSWDHELNPRHQIIAMERRGDVIVVRGHEINDFARLINHPGWRSVSTFRFDEDHKIAEQVYVPDEDQPDMSIFLDPPVEWLRANRPEALAEVYPDDRLVLNAENARAWVDLLREWRVETGQPQIPGQ